MNSASMVGVPGGTDQVITLSGGNAGAVPPPPSVAGSSSGGAGGASVNAAPSPLTVGKRFVKQYYQVLSTTPELIHRFYQPSSMLSHGEGSAPAAPVVFESAYGADGKTDPEPAAEQLQDRFFVKGMETRFEFKHGAIDAQPSVNGGVLLVVTGHVVYYPTEDSSTLQPDDPPIQKAFVHTFFLGVLKQGMKRSYYVHNDILRFLNPFPFDDETIDSPSVNWNNTLPSTFITEGAIQTSTSQQKSHEEPQPSTSLDEPTKQEALMESSSETTMTKADEEVGGDETVRHDSHPSVSTQQLLTSTMDATEGIELNVVEFVEKNVAPGGGVEESKEEEVDSTDRENGSNATVADEAATEESKDDARGKAEQKHKAPVPLRGGRKAHHHHRNAKQSAAPASQQQKPVPGSWASLVAGGGGSVGSPSPSGAAPPPAPAVKTSKVAQVNSKPAPGIDAAEEAQLSASSEKENASSNSERNADGDKGSGSAGKNSNSNHVSQGQNSSTNNIGNKNNNSRPQKRDPDCTLVIKNLADNTKEADVLSLFEPFAAETKARVVGISVSAHRGIAFVDYDSVDPVMKATELHQKEPLRLLGRILEVDQKTAEQRARRAHQRGNAYRSGSPGNNGYRGGGGGGRSHSGRREGGGRRGGRGGGRGGSGGGGGGNSGGGGR